MENNLYSFVMSQADDGATDERRSALTPAVPDSGPMTVLIIEDEKAHFQLMKRAIRKELPKATVLHATSAAGCLEALAGIKPDIILVDYLLPGMTGLEFLTAANQRGCEIPIILITGQGDERIAVQAMKLGAQDYLVKSADFFPLLPAVILKAARERRLELNLRKGVRLNEILLDSLPYPALMIGRDRMVLAANHTARAMGVRVGGACWQNFRHGTPQCPQQIPEDPCPFCRADEALELRRAIKSSEYTLNGRVWDICWISIDREVCLSYAIDITERKKAEDALRFLSDRLMTVQEEERTRIARELHDSIGSSLCAIRLSLQNLQKGQPAVDSLQKTVAMTQAAIDEVRRIMTDLRPSILDELGILAALRWFCRQFTDLHPAIHVRQQVDLMERDIPEALKIVILRIVQESFNNIAKYSQAKSVTLSLAKQEGTLRLCVLDTGIGFDPQAALPGKGRGTGIGLVSMKERAELSGGAFILKSGPGQGTSVTASWPLGENGIKP
jgi:signal transduction histidine kinase